MASFLLLAWLYRRLGAFPTISLRQTGAVVLLGCTGIVAYNLLFFSGLQTVEAGRAALIIALNPVMIALASAWLFGERLSPHRSLGIVLSVLGAIVVIGRGNLPGLLRSGIGPGEVLLLGCVASWVVYTLLGKRLLSNMRPLVAVTYSSIAGTLMLGLLFAWRGGASADALREPAVWTNVTYLALFGTALAFVWYYRGVHALGAARAGQFINLVPVSGVCLGALLLDETVTTSLLAGGSLVVVGLWLTNRPAAPRRASSGRQ